VIQVHGVQGITVVNKIRDQGKRDEFNTRLTAEVGKAAEAGVPVMILVRYELARQDDSSPMALSDTLPASTYSCLSVLLHGQTRAIQRDEAQKPRRSLLVQVAKAPHTAHY
jgi:hypothetical protein